MSNNDETGIPDWLAKEMLRQAETGCKERLEGLNKTKDRASTMLGWTVGIVGLAIGVAIKGGNLLRPAEVFVGGGLLITGLCVFVLVGTGWEPAWIYPIHLEKLVSETGTASESNLQLIIADKLAERNHRNASRHRRLQTALLFAWLLSVFVPIISLLVALFLGDLSL